MAAPLSMEDVCRICGCQLPKKHRRVIFGDTFGVFDQLTQIIDHVASPCDGLSKYVCGFCFTKLNKLKKIDFDLVTKLDALRREKMEIVGNLREKHKQSGIQKTPTSSKRVIIHSPTPRKSKCKKSLFTGTSKVQPIQATAQTQVRDTSESTMISTDTKPIKIKSFTPSKIKVGNNYTRYFSY